VYIRAPTTGLLKAWDALAAGGCDRSENPLLIKRKDARRCRLQSTPRPSEAHPTIFQTPLKTLRQYDCSTFIRIIATIVQGFFIFYEDPRLKLIPDRSPTLWLSNKSSYHIIWILHLLICVNDGGELVSIGPPEMFGSIWASWLYDVFRANVLQ